MPTATETIAAIATAAGRGAVGIIRLSGPGVSVVARKILRLLPAPRQATLCNFYGANDELLDRGLCLYFPGPASYTGEDQLELQAHGGPAVLQALLQACLAFGARPARPGEFTERAFLNGKIDLLQAEAVASLIDAASHQAVSAAARACSGDFSSAVSSISAGLRDVMTLLEASIDFADETADVEMAVRKTLERTLAELDELLLNARAGARLGQGLDVAIVGRPNSGKSTLLNKLCREDRAIVTPVPGTTRDILSVDINLDGLAVRLHDTAGLRETEDIVEQEGLRRARDLISRCDLVLHLRAVDETTEESPDEISNARRIGKPILTVLNKLDLRGEAPTLVLREGEWLASISAREGLGLQFVSEALLNMAGGQAITDAPFIARTRHVHAIQAASEAARIADSELSAGAVELACEQLRRATRSLEEMTGVYTTEALLGDIFSRFCIGK